MKCSNCSFENTMGAKFCEKCGAKMPEETDAAFMPESAPTPAPVTEKSKGKKRKGIYIAIASVLCVALLVGVGIWIFNEYSPAGKYDKQIKLGYELLEEGNYEEAIIAFDKAIKIDKKKPEGYVGKATAYSKTINDDTVKLVSETLKEGYNQTKSDAIIDAYINIAQDLKDSGEEDIAMALIIAGYDDTNNKNLQKEAKDAISVIASEYEGIIGAESSKGYVYSYRMYDIDKNRIPEIIIESSGTRGTCTQEVYTYQDGHAISLGQFITSDITGLGALWSMPGENGMLSMYTFSFYVNEQDTYRITDSASKWSIENGKLKETNISENTTYGDEYPEWTTAQSLVKGCELITTFDISDTIGIYSYFNNYGDDVYAAYSDVLDNTTDEYYLFHDFDKDGTEELITYEVEYDYHGWENCYCVVYSLKDGKIVRLTSFETDGQLYLDNDILVFVEYIDLFDTFKTSYCKLLYDNGNWSLDYFMESTDYVSEQSDENDIYTYKDKSVSEEEYNKKVSSMKIIENSCVSDKALLKKTIK